MLGHGPRCFHGGTDRYYDASEFDQHSIAHELDDAAVVLEFRVDDVVSKRVESSELTFFVGSDEPRIANHISSKYGGQSAFHDCLPKWKNNR